MLNHNVISSNQLAGWKESTESVYVAIKMGCKNCDNVSLEDYENAMFAHLITERRGKWYVRTDSGIIKEFKSHTAAKEFIFMGGVQDGH